MTKTLIHKRPGLDPPSTVHSSARFVFWGAVIGIIVAMAALFAGSTFFAAASGMQAAECATFACFATVLLSQPAAVVGLAVGAVCGGVCAFVAHHVHMSRKSDQ